MLRILQGEKYPYRGLKGSGCHNISSWNTVGLKGESFVFDFRSSMKKRRKSCLYFNTAKALKRSRMLREIKHKSRAGDVSGVAKVLDYTKEGEILLQVDGIQDRKVELIVDGDVILDTMII